MSTYTGKAVTIDVTPEVIAEKFGDLTALRHSVDALPAEQRAKLGDTHFEKDAIIIKNPQAGEIKFKVVERSPQLIKMVAGGLLPMQMLISLAEDGPSSTKVCTTIDIDLPVMLKPFVGPYMQKAADHFGTLLANIAATKDTTSNNE